MRLLWNVKRLLREIPLSCIDRILRLARSGRVGRRGTRIQRGVVGDEVGYTESVQHVNAGIVHPDFIICERSDFDLGDAYYDFAVWSNGLCDGAVTRVVVAIIFELEKDGVVSGVERRRLRDHDG